MVADGGEGCKKLFWSGSEAQMTSRVTIVVSSVLMMFVNIANAGDMASPPLSRERRKESSDGTVAVSLDREGKKTYGSGIKLHIKGGASNGLPVLCVDDAMGFLDAKLDAKVNEVAVVFDTNLGAAVYRRYRLNGGRWESDIGGGLGLSERDLSKVNQAELTDVNTFRVTFRLPNGLVPKANSEEDRARIYIVDAEGNLTVDGTKVGVLKGKKIVAPSEGSSAMADTNRVVEAATAVKQDENAERVKKVIGRLCRGGSDEDVAEALMLLKDVTGGNADDLAVLTLYVMKSRVVGLSAGEWKSSMASNYYQCVSHLKRVRLERENIKQWKDYPLQTAFALELTGGDKMMSLVIRGKWLVELDQYVQRVKRATGGDASEVDAFVKKEAKAILAEWPDANLRETMRVLSGEITAKDLDQEMEQKRKVADQQRGTL